VNSLAEGAAIHASESVDCFLVEERDLYWLPEYQRIISDDPSPNVTAALAMML
jgi:hypothetical protein